MRILIVGFPTSIHVAKAIQRISDQQWDIHLFPTYDTDNAVPHPLIRNVTIHTTQKYQDGAIDPSNHVVRLPESAAAAGFPERLAQVIYRIQPDIVHSMELQHCSYMTLDAHALVRGPFPSWIVSNWGSDIYLFGRIPKHAKRIRDLLATADYYTCECARDIKIARQFGFAGTVLPVVPIAGGFDLDELARFRSAGRVSDRRIVLLKGYQHWCGRSLTAMLAARLCAKQLLEGKYRIQVYSHGNNPDVAFNAELLEAETGVPVELVPHLSHDDVLRMFGSARAYVGLSISDGISTSLLEAIAMGAFPIQSHTACADEWFEHGEGGLLAPPENPDEVATLLRRALTDDALVDRAAAINAGVTAQRLDFRKVAKDVVAQYEQVYEDAPTLKRNRRPLVRPSLPARLSDTEAKLSDAEAKLGATEAKLRDSEAKLSERVKELEQRAADAESQVQALESRIRAIYDTGAWKLGYRVAVIIQMAAPPGSVLRRLVTKALRAVDVMRELLRTATGRRARSKT